MCTEQLGRTSESMEPHGVERVCRIYWTVGQIL